jgi:tetratricopeptide (TPR) repeat protein
MQMLGELGIVGLVLLATFVAAVYAAAGGALRRRGGHLERFVAVGSLGAFTAWLTDTSVDWLWNLPGVTGMAVLAGGCLLTAGGRSAGRWRPRWLGVVAIAALALAAASLGRQWLAHDRLSSASSALASNPAAAIRAANRSLGLDAEALDTYYVKAAGYARLDRYADARTTLLAAVRREPHSYVTWALLGDLATRRGDRQAARAAYRHARELNPRDAIGPP